MSALSGFKLGICGSWLLAAVACGPSFSNDLPKATSTGEAFGGVQCSAVRPPTEPDLMAWDAGSRAKVNYLRTQGIVAVRYRAEGCNVELEVLSNCIGKGEYFYSPYSATETKILHNNQELYAELPVGAAQLGGKLKRGRALRTDYALVGVNALPPSSTFSVSDLRGPDCSRATHVVSALYVGGFAMVAGNADDIEASGSVFSAKAGGHSGSSAESVAREGISDACDRAQSAGTEERMCSVPLRMSLLAIPGTGDRREEPMVRTNGPVSSVPVARLSPAAAPASVPVPPSVPMSWSEPASSPEVWGSGDFTCLPVRIPQDRQSSLTLQLSNGETADLQVTLAYAPELCRRCQQARACPALGLGDQALVDKLAARLARNEISEKALLRDAGRPVVQINLLTHGSIATALRKIWH